MTLPAPRSVHIDGPLTNISVAYIQESAAFIADRVFPMVPVTKQSDRYFRYDRGDWLRNGMAQRAPATEATRGVYRIDNTPNYYCRNYAYAHAVPWEVMNNADAPLNPLSDATQIVTQKALILREKLWMDAYFKASVWGYERAGVASAPNASQKLHWSNAAATPIADVREAATAIHLATGTRPNKLVLGRQVFDALVEHPSIIDRLNRGQTTGPAQASRENLAALFEVSEVLVADAVENTAAEGATDTLAFIAGKHALLTYACPTPSLLKHTGGYIFTWRGQAQGMEPDVSGYGISVRTWTEAARRCDVVEAEYSFDMHLVDSGAGAFFNGIIP